MLPFNDNIVKQVDNRSLCAKRYEGVSCSTDAMSGYCTTLPSVVSSYSEKDLLESAWSWVRSPLFAEGYRNRGEKENSSSSFLTDITTCSLSIALLPPSPSSSAAAAATAAATDHDTNALSGEGKGITERESSLTIDTSAPSSTAAAPAVTAAGLLLSWIQQHDTTHPNFKVRYHLLIPHYSTLCPSPICTQNDVCTALICSPLFL